MLHQVALSSPDHSEPPWLPPKSLLLHLLEFPAWLQTICSISAGCVQGQWLGSCQQPRPAQTRQCQGSAPSFKSGSDENVTQLASEPQHRAKPYRGGQLQLRWLQGATLGWDGSIALPCCSQEPVERTAVRPAAIKHHIFSACPGKGGGSSPALCSSSWPNVSRSRLLRSACSVAAGRRDQTLPVHLLI